MIITFPWETSFYSEHIIKVVEVLSPHLSVPLLSPLSFYFFRDSGWANRLVHCWFIHLPNKSSLQDGGTSSCSAHFHLRKLGFHLLTLSRKQWGASHLPLLGSLGRYCINNNSDITSGVSVSHCSLAGVHYKLYQGKQICYMAFSQPCKLWGMHSKQLSYENLMFLCNLL